MTEAKKSYNLLLVDANSIVYRTYFASQKSNMSLNGQPVGAVYGFFNILLKALQQYQPEYVAFCWDLKGPTFRHEMYDAYKGNRSATPDDLLSQIPLLQNCLAYLGFPQFAKDRYEADDLIGSLAKSATEAALQTLILSGDKDDFQLITEQVDILMPKGGGIYELIDEAYLQANYGVNGAGWLQMKAIMGDSSDNIPGIKGIGIKGAAKLIQEYGTIANLLQNIKKLSKKQQENITNALEDLKLSLELSRINCRLDLLGDWQLLKKPQNLEAGLTAVFNELQFNSLLQRYQLYTPHADFVEPFAKAELFVRNLLVPNSEMNCLVVAEDRADSITEDLANFTFKAQDLHVEQSNLRLLLNHLTLFYEKYARLKKADWQEIAAFLNSIAALDAELACNCSQLLSVNPEHIQVKVLEKDFIALNYQKISPWIYLPGLKVLGKEDVAYYPVNSETEAFANATQFAFVDDLACGFLWSPLLSDTFFSVNSTILKELLPVLQLSANLPTLNHGAYESAKLFTFNLKETLKLCSFYQLRPVSEQFTFTRPTESLQKLYYQENKTKDFDPVKANTACKSLTALADIDVMAYIFGSQTTNLRDVWYQDLQSKALKLALVDVSDSKRVKEIQRDLKKGKFSFLCKELYDFCKNITLFLDLAHCQISLAALAPLTYQMELPLVSVLAEMEEPRLQLDLAALAKLRLQLLNSMQAAEREVMFIAGETVNLNSPEQVSDLLFNKLALPKPTSKKNKSGFISTKSEYLQTLSPFYPVVSGILDYRKYQKLLTFADGLLANSDPQSACISTEYQQIRTATGRLSSINPNLQNIPVRSEEGHNLRSVFVAKAGKILLDIDYSQIELRIVAALAGDQALLAAFNDETDVHSEVAAKIFNQDIKAVTVEQRAKAKAINFSLIYGATIFGTAERLKVSFKEAENYLDSYFSKYTAIRPYMQYLIALAKANDYISTAYGRRRYLGNSFLYKNANLSFKDLKEELYRQPEAQTQVAAAQAKKPAVFANVDNRIYINTPIQGTGADIIKLAMVATKLACAQADLDVAILLQVHDELLIEVAAEQEAKAAKLIKRCMENVIDLGVKLEVNLVAGQNWAEIH